MIYTSRHEDLLARLSAVAQARSIAIERATRKRNRERARHLEEMRKIRDEHDSMNARLAELLEEAARKKVPQALISEVVGLSRNRLHQIRKGVAQ